MSESFDTPTLARLVLAQVDVSPHSLRLTPIRIWPKPDKHNISCWVGSARGRFALRVRIAPPDDAGFLFYERLMMRQEPGQTGQPGLGKRQKVGLDLNPLVADPSENRLTRLSRLEPSGAFWAMAGKLVRWLPTILLISPAKVQVLQVPGWLSRVQLLQGCPNSTMPTCFVAQGILLTKVSIEACHDFR